MTTPTEWRETIYREIDRRLHFYQNFEPGSGGDWQARRGSALEHYADELIEWASDWAWTYDPRNQNRDLPVYLPFHLAPRQREMLEWRQDVREREENGSIPKSRGTGASYLACTHHTHCWLFEDGFSGKLLGEKEEQVDKRGDPDSLFQKVRIELEFLPDWQWPDGFNEAEHDNHRRLINPQTGATIVGNIGQNPGRGGRGSMADIDEAAYIENLVEARRAMYNNCTTVFEISTFNGTGEPFYRRIQQVDDDKVFWITWQDIPFYDDDWYDKKRKEYEEAGDLAGLAQEVDADPEASVDNTVCPPEWVNAAIAWEPPEEAANGERRGSLDVAGSGSNENVYAERKGAIVEAVQTIDETNTTKTAREVRGLGNKRDIARLHYDDIGVGSGVGDSLVTLPTEPQFKVHPFVASDKPTDKEWPTGQTSADRFKNLRAECWWEMRLALKRTHEVVEGDADHDPATCLSLPDETPDDAELTSQMKQPRWEKDTSGRIQIESKQDMQSRGVPSPDHADALMQTFAPIDQDNGWVMLT